MAVDKVIVTNLTALKQKYQAAGVKAIQAAVQDLIAADKQRGLITTLVALDDKAGMKKLSAPVVTDAADPKQNKRAIDGVYKALVPDYLMILGAPDVVPHQDIKNPIFNAPGDDPNEQGDEDEFAPSDLPYACDAPYSQNAHDFTGPTRVVGRLPDVTGATGSPKYLLGLLKTATKWRSRPREEYQNYFGLSAEIWQKSTAESLKKVFNSDTDIQTCPTKGYEWERKLCNRLIHFVNCHGGKAFPNFLGQAQDDRQNMPVSHLAVYVARAKNLAEGTVAAVECCYGGQLYDPAEVELQGYPPELLAKKNQMGMCNVYLAKKAYGFFASTTIAYGPATHNDWADLICQYFVQRVLAGASLGRAALEARQRFVEQNAPMSPTDLKTLAQFNLFGDPSITPVAAPTSKLAVGARIVHLTTGVPPTGAKGMANAKAIYQVASAERAERRQTLRAKGTMLASIQPTITRTETAPSKQIADSFAQLAQQLNLRQLGTVSYNCEAPAPAPTTAMSSAAKGIMKAAALKKPDTTAFHVFVGTPQASAAEMKSMKKGAGKKGAGKAGAKGAQAKKHPVRHLVVLEAKEVGGNIVISEGHSK